MQWIDTKDRMPEPLQDVLVAMKHSGFERELLGDDGIAMAYRCASGWMATDTRAIPLHSVTHWMPLPELPN